MKVLIVDDTEFYIKTYRIKLLSEGYEVKSATDGLGALKQLKADKPDILLLDLMMPVMDGFKVLQTMKSDPGLEDIPVVVFSAKGDMEEVSKAMEAGASDFLVKATTTPNKVVEKINKVLSR
ncbi:MAG TPA: response regulator [Nitrospiria bacterium]|nr:response regulator [Nitrospiria bacterium]